MAMLPKLKLKALVSFPSNVYGGTGIEVVKTNGNFTIDLDYREFAFSGTLPPNTNVLVWDPVTDTYVLVPPSATSGISDAPSDSQTYGRNNAAWVQVTAPSPAIATPLSNGAAAVGVSLKYAREDHVHPAGAAGSGDVTGPASAVADNIATYNGATGKVIKDSGLSTAAVSGAVRYDTAQGLTAGQQAQGRTNIAAMGAVAVQLANGTDLNTVTTPGFYDGMALVNAPDSLTGWFYIEVSRHSASAGFLVQKAHTLDLTNNQRSYIRWQVGGTWSPWQVLITGGAQTLTATQQSQARANIAVPNPNVIINGDFRINQEGYVSAAALAAGAYGHDQWKAGAGGGDYSFTQLKSSTQITIASGKSLIQPIEDVRVVGGSYVLSWTGTAQARAGVNTLTPSGAYAASPLLIAGQTAGTVMSVEFNNGTLGTVKLESGSIATPFHSDYAFDLALCQRYWARIMLNARFHSGGASVMSYQVGWPQAMRVMPTVVMFTAGGSTNITGATLAPSDHLSGSYNMTAGVAGDSFVSQQPATLNARIV